MARQHLIRPPALLAVALIAMLWVQGCAHTLFPRSPGNGSGRSIVLGIKSFYDVSGFDYSRELKTALGGEARLASIMLTADLGDPRCDYVIKGSFCYYRVKTWTTFYYTSIYFLWLPLLSGLPSSNLDGAMTAEIEVYRKGALFKTFAYEDFFREPRSYATVYPTATSLDAELNRVAKCLKVDLVDLFL